MSHPRPHSSRQSRLQSMVQSLTHAPMRTQFRIGTQHLTSAISNKLSLSIGAQALVSGFHFLLNLILVRELSLYAYGIFAFAFVLVMFGNAINNALISTPLTVYTPVITNPDERNRQEVLLGSANILLVITLLLCGLAYGLIAELAWLNAAGVALFVGINSARQFSRSTGYAKLRPLVTAAGEGGYVVSSAIMIALILWRSEQLSVGPILLALTAGQCIAILYERLQLYGKMPLRIDWKQLSDYHLFWEQSRWGLLGALTTLLMGQAHSVIITSTLGPAAFAPLAAGFVLFGPVRVALMTWQNLVKPEIAVALSENEHSKVKRQIRRTALFAALAAVLLALFLALCWPLIDAVLYGEKYADYDMVKIVALWAIITLFAAMYNAPGAALQALKEFKILAWASIYGAAISVVLVMLILHWSEPTNTLYGILCAELFTMVFLTYVVGKKLKADT